MKSLTKKRIDELNEKYGQPIGYIHDVPVLDAIPRIDWSPGWRIFCKYCLCWHLHGMWEDENLAHRVAHCAKPESQYKYGGGYFLLKNLNAEEKD